MFSTPRRRFFMLFLFGALAFAALALSLQAIFAIRDCTTPTGSCHRDEQARTNQLVATTREIIVAAAECSVQLDVEARRAGVPLDAHQIGSCVDRRLSHVSVKPR